jgi:hypothetical protein
MNDDQIKRVAEAIKQRRDELIAQPLSRVYEQLAMAAIAAMAPPEDGEKEDDDWV